MDSGLAIGITCVALLFATGCAPEHVKNDKLKPGVFRPGASEPLPGPETVMGRRYSINKTLEKEPRCPGLREYLQNARGRRAAVYVVYDESVPSGTLNLKDREVPSYAAAGSMIREDTQTAVEDLLRQKGFVIVTRGELDLEKIGGVCRENAEAWTEPLVRACPKLAGCDFLAQVVVADAYYENRYPSEFRQLNPIQIPYYRVNFFLFPTAGTVGIKACSASHSLSGCDAMAKSSSSIREDELGQGPSYVRNKLGLPSFEELIFQTLTKLIDCSR
jgi:hypothetical protein